MKKVIDVNINIVELRRIISDTVVNKVNNKLEVIKQQIQNIHDDRTKLKQENDDLKTKNDELKKMIEDITEGYSDEKRASNIKIKMKKRK